MADPSIAIQSFFSTSVLDRRVSRSSAVSGMASSSASSGGEDTLQQLIMITRGHLSETGVHCFHAHEMYIHSHSHVQRYSLAILANTLYSIVPMFVLGVPLTQTKSTRSPYRFLIVERPHRTLLRLPLFLQLKKNKNTRGKNVKPNQHLPQHCDTDYKIQQFRVKEGNHLQIVSFNINIIIIYYSYYDSVFSLRSVIAHICMVNI